MRYVVMNEEKNSKRVNTIPERTPTTTDDLLIRHIDKAGVECSLGLLAMPNTCVRAKR